MDSQGSKVIAVPHHVATTRGGDMVEQVKFSNMPHAKDYADGCTRHGGKTASVCKVDEVYTAGGAQCVTRRI